MKRRIQLGALSVFLLLTCRLTGAADLESFEFNDGAGTSLALAANTANPGNQWVEDPQMFPSDVRNGGFNVTLESTVLESNYLQINNITSGTYYLTARMSGWNFGSTLDAANLEEVRFGFLNDDTSPTFGSTVSAQMMLRRNVDGNILLTGDALGAGSTAPTGAGQFAPTRNTPLAVTLEFNKTSNTYKVFYKDNTLATQVLGIGAIAPTRNGNALRFATNNSFGEGNTDYPVVPANEVFTIDRIALSDTNPYSDLITLEINRTSGAMTLRNTSGAAINGVESYTIASPAGGLNPAGWAPIAGGTNSSSNTQLQQTFGAPINLTNGQNTVLSSASGAWLQSPFEDLTMVLNLAGGTSRTVNVNFINNDGERFDAGDLNFDGSITAADYVILAANAETSLTGLSAVDSYRRGDLSGDGLNSIADFIQFKTRYEELNGAGSFAAVLAQVPEPVSWLMSLSGLLIYLGHRRRTSKIARHSGRTELDDFALIHSHSGDIAMSGMRVCVLVLLAFTVLGAITGRSDAAILEDYMFNDTNNTLLEESTNSVNASNFWVVDGNLNGSSVQAGSYRIQKGNQALSSNYLDIANITTGKAWLVAEIAGWSLSSVVGTDDYNSAEPEEVRFAFLNNDNNPPSGSTITAQAVFIRDTSNGGFDLRGIGPAGGANDLPNSFDLSLTRATPFTVAVEINTDSDQYSIYYKDDANPYALLGTTNYVAGREGNSLRLAINNSFAGGGEFFDINRLYVTNTSPIDTPVDPITLSLEVRSNGQVYIKNETANPISFDSYRIASGSSALNVAGWSSLADQNIDPFMGGNDPGEKWTEAGGSSDAVLSESFLLSASTLAPDQELFLGSAFKIGGAQDLTFQYRDTGTGALPSVVPTYVTVAGVAGDYNQDGTVNAADYTIWRDHLNQNFQLQNEGGITPGVVNQADYDFWKSRFGANSGAGSASPVAAVPEPTAGLLAALLAIGAAIGSRRRG